MTMPSNKWEEVVEQALDELAQGWQDWTYDQLDGTSFIKEELDKIERAKSEAKIALTNAVKELVETAKPESLEVVDESDFPGMPHTLPDLYNHSADTYQANLLKAIGE